MSHFVSGGRDERQVAAVVLAAGKGTRMKSARPKVLHEILGEPIIGWVLRALTGVAPVKTVVVVGHGSEEVCNALPEGVEIAHQEKQRGSGDALVSAMSSLAGFDGTVIVINGDGPLFRADTLKSVIDGHTGAVATGTALGIRGSRELPYGRLLCNENNELVEIVEASEATPEQLDCDLLNAGVYAFEMSQLSPALSKLDAENSKGEIFITDLFGIIRGNGGSTVVVEAGGPDELLGVNTLADLATAEKMLTNRIIDSHLATGVTVRSRCTVTIGPDTVIDPDAIIEKGSTLLGRCNIGAGAVVGPYTTLTDMHVGSNAEVIHSYCAGSSIGDGAKVGPFAYIRPDVTMAEETKAGAFVELKNTRVGARSKIPHLSYIGDATIGTDSNIGAGTITANYRPELGGGKQPTRIGSRTRTGSDNVFVAPVNIGDDAFTGAGSIIVNDVPDNALAIARARQVNLQDYAQRIKGASGNSSNSGNKVGDKAGR